MTHLDDENRWNNNTAALSMLDPVADSLNQRQHRLIRGALARLLWSQDPEPRAGRAIAAYESYIDLAATSPPELLERHLVDLEDALVELEAAYRKRPYKGSDDMLRICDDIDIYGIHLGAQQGVLTRPRTQHFMFGVTADLLGVRYIITPKQEAEKTKRSLFTTARILPWLDVAQPLLRPCWRSAQPPPPPPASDREAMLDQGLARLAILLRDVIGNPYRTTHIAPSWMTPGVRSVAAELYASREYDRMGDLEAELWDAGCRDSCVLLHCCDRVEHFRGCWLLDRLR